MGAAGRDPRSRADGAFVAGRARCRAAPPLTGALANLWRAASAPCLAVILPGRMTISFLLTSLIVVASPGTGVLYTLAVALAQGSRAGIAAAFGCTLGIVPHMVAAM